MWLQINNTTTRVTIASNDELSWLHDFLSVENTGARYMRRAPKDDRIRLFSLVSRTFPTGFLGMVRQEAMKANIAIELHDSRAKPCVPRTDIDLSWLTARVGANDQPMTFQRDAVDRVLTRTRGILHIPTGGGKTECAVALGMLLPCRWLFLVHRTGLMDQAADRFELRTREYDIEGGEAAGRIGEGQWDEQRFTCATFQTLYAALKTPGERRKRALTLLESVGGLVVDESHCLPAASLMRVARCAKNAYWRVGLSGTPLARGDRRSIMAIGMLGDVIYRIRPEVLIAAGLLSKPHIRMVIVEQNTPRIGQAWAEIYASDVVNSAKRNHALVTMTKRATKPCLLFVQQVEHGHILTEALQLAGLRAAFVWGTADVETRRNHISLLEQGELDVIVCSVIFQEGVDIPTLRSVVVGTGGKSVIAALQRVGRGMRVSDGKQDFEVYDVLDASPKGANGWLAKHARGRLRSYSREGYETTVQPINCLISK